ncbi:TolC family protein [Pelosinus propionicus]|uniref:Outer membrane protein TolC n=1 Tax=Pelosinus propionicus DSM 13327 TaxID=1123291 RepID=A0A1I4N8J2_9FIRM|nr:TolC family protein [Pelosinus propionicus]SFM11831.1 Outer membrane protein TolC [Pelosinus propionicus DSM 13327]
MNFRRTFFCAGITLLCWGAPNWGYAAPLALTLPESIHLALTRSHAVKIAELDAAKASLEIKRNKATYWPTVSMTHEHTQIEKSPKPEYGNYLTAKLPLSDGGRTKSLVMQSQEFYEGAADNLEHTKQQVTANTMLAYYNVLQAKSREDLANQIVENLNQHLAQAKLQDPAKADSKKNVLRIESKLAQARQNYIRIHNERQLVTSQLTSLLQIQPDQELILSEIPGQSTPETLDLAIQTALQQRNDLKQARKEQAVAQWGIKVAASNKRPNIYLLFVASDLWLPEQYWYTTVSVSTNLFDAGRSNIQVRQASLEEARSQEYLEQKIEKITQETREAFYYFQQADIVMKEAAQFLAKSTEDYEVAVLEFQSGKTTNEDLLNSYSTLTEAKTNHINTLYDYHKCRVHLLRVTGMLPVTW